MIKVEGMHCPLCTTAVKKAVNDLEGIEKVSARLNTKEVTVTYFLLRFWPTDVLIVVPHCCGTLWFDR